MMREKARRAAAKSVGRRRKPRVRYCPRMVNGRCEDCGRTKCSSLLDCAETLSRFLLEVRAWAPVDVEVAAPVEWYDDDGNEVADAA